MQEAVKNLLVTPFLTSGYGVDIDQVLNAPFTVDYSEMVFVLTRHSGTPLTSRPSPA